MKNFGKLLILLGVIAILVALLPWLSCVNAHPENLSELRITLGEARVAAGGSASELCWEAQPIWREQLPLGVGFGGLLLGVLFVGLGGNGNTRRADLPEHLKREANVRQRPIDTRSKNDLSKQELEHGIEVDLSELGLGQADSEVEKGSRVAGRERQDSLMDQVGMQLETQRRTLAIKLDQQSTVEGFYSPQGMSQLPILFVDPAHELASQDASHDELGSKTRPFGTIEGAMRRARQLVRETQQGVQVRLMPGIYQERVTIPPRVALVNHRMPAEGDLMARLRWLRAQPHMDSADRVTLVAPVSESAAVVFEGGVGHGLFGCHVVGRVGVEQIGLLMKRADDSMIMSCVIEQCEGGAVFMEHCGTDLLATGAKFIGCHFHDNKANEGGAIAAKESALSIEACLFERNVAQRGGAICAWGMRAPLTISQSEFNENKAQIKHLPAGVIEDYSPGTWEESEGTGGAIWLGASQLKLTVSDFRGNGASLAGGSLALIACQAIVHGEKEDPIRFLEGRARAAGAILVVGGFGEKEGGTLKLAHAQLERNFGQQGGGAMLLVGGSVAQLNQARFEHNATDEIGGAGGAIYAIHGAELLANKVFVLANKAARGAGVASLNAAMILKDHAIFQDNTAELGACGAIFVSSRRCDFLEEAIGAAQVKLPFITRLLDVEAVGNTAMEEPSAVGIGAIDGMGDVMALGVELGEGLTLRSNRVQGKPATEQRDPLQIRWKGKVELSAGSRIKPQKFLLK